MTWGVGYEIQLVLNFKNCFVFVAVHVDRSVCLASYNFAKNVFLLFGF